MSENFSRDQTTPLKTERKPVSVSVKAFGYSLLVLTSFIAAQVLLVALLYVVKLINPSAVADLQQPAYQTVLSVVVYALTIGITFAVPWLLRRSKVTLEDLGLTRLPEWKDILLAPAGFIIYLLIAFVLAYVAAKIWPSFNGSQAQDVGFDDLVGSHQYLLAFLTLVVIAPVAEEILMRGYLYGKLRKLTPVVVAAVVTSLVFGIMHFQWNVGVNVFALSLVMCGLREVTGSIWAGILLHMMKNGLAFYLLFVNPSILKTVGIL